MDFTDDRPIYRQIVDWMGEKIVRGEWPEGERILSVRELAMLLQVNPNTAMRAYDSLQEDGAIFNRRGIGYFVAEGGREKILSADRRLFFERELPAVLSRMEMLGIDAEELAVRYSEYKSKKTGQI